VRVEGSPNRSCSRESPHALGPPRLKLSWSGERHIAEVNGSGPLFWKITPGDNYPRQLKEANRELRELTGLKDIRPHDLRRPHSGA